MSSSSSHQSPVEIIHNLKKEKDYLTATFALTDPSSQDRPLALMSPGSCTKLYNPSRSIEGYTEFS
jgi:hypothetical protein